MNKKKLLIPGEKIEISGQYKIKGPRGGLSKTELTLVEGKKTPPTKKANQKLILVDKTKHKNKK